jgi:predicted dinucleotide-binding enzyme
MAQAKVWALDPPLFDGRPMTVFYCGDDEQAKQKVAQLITEMGFEPLDIGALRQARLLEPAGNMVIYLLFNGYSPYTVLNLSKRDDWER